jgi:hypothetical protein
MSGAQSSGVSWLQTPAQFDRLIALSASLGMVGQVELYRACREGRINLISLRRDTPLPRQLLRGSQRPLCVIVGDDDYCSTGPSGWACTPRLLRWCASAIVHATGADVASYQTAVVATVGCARLALIETDNAHGETWARAFLTAQPRMPILWLRVPDGRHPVMPPRESMQ